MSKRIWGNPRKKGSKRMSLFKRIFGGMDVQDATVIVKDALHDYLVHSEAKYEKADGDEKKVFRKSALAAKKVMDMFKKGEIEIAKK